MSDIVARRSIPVAESDVDRVVASWVQSQNALGAAMRDLPTTSPQAARSAQATENVWRAIDAEFGLLTGTDVGRLLGSTSASSRNLAASKHKFGVLLAVQRGKALRYPGFQFRQGDVLSVISDLRKLANEHDWTEASTILWMVAPHGRLSGRRPVDIIDDPEQVLEVAAFAMAAEW
ncbi:hypothetical protein BH09ACT10_BH09ACT10_04480 [soil metagenome]